MTLVRSMAVLLVTSALVACNASSSSSSAAAGSSTTQGSSGPAPSVGSDALGAHSVELKFTGRYEKADQPGSEVALFSVTNKSTKKLHYVEAWHYYYDKDKKQLGRKYTAKTVGTMDPGQSRELVFGWTRGELPSGTEFMESVLVAANFEGGAAFKGDVKALAPEQRSMGATTTSAAGATPGSSPNASPTSAEGTAPASAADYADLTGGWISDWGGVKLDGRNGTYTDTYGGGIGKLEFSKTGDHEYTATWGESKMRHGTMKVTLSADGKKLTGTWTPDPDVTVGGKGGGPINWIKR
jgi:hypothetical protein